MISHPARDGYDIPHWNSIEPHGNAVIASFRQLDAVYKINKATGNIVWKLGGTTTTRSLKVIGDPHSYPLGGQHDARVLPDGTLSVFDNRTALTDRRPGWCATGSTRWLERPPWSSRSRDPDIPLSYCCGSARHLPNGDWLIDWGQQTPGPGRAARSAATPPTASAPSC